MIYCLLLGLSVALGVHATPRGEDHVLPLPDSPGELYLENSVPCLDRNIRYRKRPQSIVNVRTQVSMIAIHSLSSTNMDLAADLYLYQSWTDLRCGFKPLPGQGTKLTLYSGQSLSNLWQPDTHFLNAKKSQRPETVTRILSRGYVETRTRFNVVISCPMDLRLFPLDRQMCSFIIQSSAHPKEEVTYYWKYGVNSSLPFVQGLKFQVSMTPDIRLLAYRFRDAISQSDELTGAKYHQLIFDIFLERPLGYFIWEVYMPASFIVVIAFSNFWLDRAATPARVSLGVTTVLTMTTLLSNANDSLPHTAYPKAIGIFLAGCFFFTFLAFLEFSFASFIERKRGRITHPSQSKQEELAEAEMHFDSQALPSLRKRKNTLAEIRDPLGLRPSAVELYSRLLFPVAFLAFQGGYWLTCYLCVGDLPQDARKFSVDDYY